MQGVHNVFSYGSSEKYIFLPVWISRNKSINVDILDVLEKHNDMQRGQSYQIMMVFVKNISNHLLR